MLDYEALNKLEKQYGNIKLVPEDNPLLSKLRKSAIGNEDDPQVRYPKISATISHDDVWVTRRLEVMGLSTIKRKRLSNAERRRHYRQG